MSEHNWTIFTRDLDTILRQTFCETVSEEEARGGNSYSTSLSIDIQMLAEIISYIFVDMALSKIC
jgi:hypothetical protein